MLKINIQFNSVSGIFFLLIIEFKQHSKALTSKYIAQTYLKSFLTSNNDIPDINPDPNALYPSSLFLYFLSKHIVPYNSAY